MEGKVSTKYEKLVGETRRVEKAKPTENLIFSLKCLLSLFALSSALYFPFH